MLHCKEKKINEYETKFIFPNSHSYSVIQYLNHNCKKDKWYPAGTVSSIYYDTRGWKYLYEKINSDYLKTKVRIRWYSDIDGNNTYNYSFIEAKHKVGSHREKIRIKTIYSGRWLDSTPLEDTALWRLPNLLRKKSVRINENLYPVFQISYKRLRFKDEYTGAQICIDYDINAPRVNGYMVPKINPFTLNTAVLEMKGNIQQLPFNLKPLSLLGCRKSSFSKYQACYQKIMQVNL